MQFSAEQLKEKLLRALDKDNNVVDMPAVLEVFSSLERLHVTKDLLEETRLGKYVNEMRKKTSNKDLSKRAKNLVRRWQAMVMPQAAHGQFNGDKLVRPGLPAYIKATAGSKPASPASRPGTPSSAASSTSPGLQTNRLSPKVGFKPVTPAKPPLEYSPALPSSVNNSNNCAIEPHRVPFSVYDTPKTHNGHSNVVKLRPVTPTNSGSSFSKTDAANKRKRRVGEGILDNDIPSKKSLLDKDSIDNGCNHNSVINGVVTSTPKQEEYCAAIHRSVRGSTSIKKGASRENLSESFSERIHKKFNTSLERTNSTSSFYSDKSEPVGHGNRTPLIMKTPRVKTTAQLLEELATSGNINVKDSATVRRIALNQIDKERDDDTPVVPVSAKPRARKKPKNITPPQTTDKTLHETKNEMVHKFLETAIPQHTPDFDLDSSSNLVHNLSTPSMEGESPNSVSIGERPRESSSFSRGETSGHSSNLSSAATNVNNNESLSKNNESINKLLQMVKVSEGTSSDSPSLKVKFTLGGGGIGDSDTSPEKNVIETASNSITDPWALLPPLDSDTIDWTSFDYTPAERVEVNDATINQLHTEHWPGVNGYYDHRQVWSNWAQSYSMPSYNGDMLHILPYVVLDEIQEEVLPDIS